MDLTSKCLHRTLVNTFYYHQRRITKAEAVNFLDLADKLDKGIDEAATILTNSSSTKVGDSKELYCHW